MRKHSLPAPIVLSVLALAFAFAGCGGGQEQQTTTTEASPSPAAPVAAAIDSPTTASRYDAGPRAGESAVNATLAATGQQLFTSKICATCHGFGRRITCPDLQGVTMRRTQQWMEQQIMNPTTMVREDPIAWSVHKGFPLEMPDQNLTEDEARALIEYLKQQDKNAGVTAR